LDAPSFHAGNDELRQYLTEAAEKSPELREKYAEWQALLERVPQVASLEDPMLTYTQFLQSDQYKYGLRLEQKFPWFGTLRARGDKALAEADGALSRFYASRNEVLAAVKRAYFEYWALGENVRITEEQTKVVANVEELIKSRYGLGLASQSDLFRIQIEKDKLDDMRKGLAQSRGSLSARLAALLGRDAGGELPWPQAAEFPPAVPAEEEVLKTVRAANPGVASLQHMVDSWEKEVVIARKKGYPEFSVEFGYDDMKDMKDYGNRMNAALVSESAKMFAQEASTGGALPALGDVAYNAGKDFYLRTPGDVRDEMMVSLRLSLPIWRKKIKAGVSEAKLMKESVQHDKRRLELALESAAKDAMFGVQDAQRRYGLYKESLITKEFKSYESLLSEYGAQVDTESGTASVGSASFVDLQDSMKALLEFQMEQVRAARDWQAAAADLEMIMGGPWAIDNGQ
jgi:outer membrane protein TolC